MTIRNKEYRTCEPNGLQKIVLDKHNKIVRTKIVKVRVPSKLLEGVEAKTTKACASYRIIEALESFVGD